MFKSKSPWYGSRTKSVGNYVCSDCNEQDTNILRGVKFIRSKYTPCSMRNCNEGKSGLLLSLYWGSQGMQPIVSFNRGAGKFDRVKRTYKMALTCNVVISCIAFVVFQLFPEQLLSIFGSGSKEYMQFGVNFFRVFLFMTFLNGIQPITSTFCTVIGEPNKGTFLSLTRQVICFIPLMLVLPIIFTTIGGKAMGIVLVLPIIFTTIGGKAMGIEGVIVRCTNFRFSCSMHCHL
ncbi:hypothetical protein DXA21_21875 [Parabacteroides distasonis]|nr:hypothetical protein DXA21_21875 [Parabacteroides distasonis]